MTKQISLCNLLQTAFVWPGFVPPRETNPSKLSRRWEQHTIVPTMMTTVNKDKSAEPSWWK